MTRNHHFHSQGPLQSHESLQLQNDRVHGPSIFFNPTRAYFTHQRLPPKAGAGSDSQASRPSDEAKHHQDIALTVTSPAASNVEYKWRSRDNRKGRHALVVKPTNKPDIIPPSRTSTFRATLQGLIRMCTYFPYWDISYLVAVIFTLGSVIWVINGFFAWLPLVRPSSEFKNEILYGGGITAFIGATVFEVGSILLVLEAINTNQEGCFGWAIDRAFTELLDHEKGLDEHKSSGGKTDDLTPPASSSPSYPTAMLKPDPRSCSHHHSNKRNLVGKGTSSPSPSSSWHWLPSPSTTSIHDLGFLAAVTQLLAATIFWIAGFTSLPPSKPASHPPPRSIAPTGCPKSWEEQVTHAH
ncbi:MAG: hypothetical protein OHK93_003590 [Ramalina farinacea]|uniref:Integral membrane protein n=1 Tax=Ramalina farinacea TaxID=258253 RepID=A0AA43TUT3_9LECA|nr:hypothetical protein [Ramalina farinacea]